MFKLLLWLVGTAIVWTVSSILVIFLFGLWLPFYIYKQFLSLFAPYIIKDITSILPSTGAILFDDYSDKAKPSCSISTIVEINGAHITVNQLTEIFERNVLNQNIKGTNQRRYPELKQYPVNVLGHPFWKMDTTFSLSNHVWENTDTNFKSIAEIHTDMLNLQYPEKRSPWQLVIFRNRDRNKTYLALRCHHCVCDGRSILKLIVEGLGQKPLISNEAKFYQQSKFKKAMFYISFPIKLVQSAIHLFKLQLKIAKQPFNSNKHHLDLLEDPVPYCVGVTKQFFLTDLKRVANQHGVRTSTVLLSAMSIAVKKFMLSSTRYNTVPRDLQVYLALPKENHPPTLLNHLLFCLVELEHKDNYVGQFDHCDTTYNQLRESDDARYFMTLSSAVATFPQTLRSYVARNQGVTMGISNISGERNEFLVGESKVTDFSMCSSPPKGTIGVSFLTMSYKDCIRVSVVAKGSKLSEQETNILTRVLEGELDNLLIKT